MYNDDMLVRDQDEMEVGDEETTGGGSDMDATEEKDEDE